MRLNITAELVYRLDEPTDLLLQIEAAAIPEQVVEHARLDLATPTYQARIAAQDMIGERIWLNAEGMFTASYEARVNVVRILADPASLPIVPLHRLPGEVVPYLMASRYCPSDQFETFVAAEFGAIEGGARIAAMRDWIGGHFAYVPGSSGSATTALESFVQRQGICRDYAHVLITLTRAAGVPARYASVYGLGVDPPDFHAVAEVFLGGEWHLIDATGMSSEAAMAKIGVGRDAADVSMLTTYGKADMVSQTVSVTAA